MIGEKLDFENRVPDYHNTDNTLNDHLLELKCYNMSPRTAAQKMKLGEIVTPVTSVTSTQYDRQKDVQALQN